MGHTEMLLAVAGLSEKTIARRVRLLTGGDWSAFPPSEQAAFHFARKLANTPASVAEEDFRGLVRYFGPERAIDVVWWSSQCHYMTRVADAFQIPLEDVNVFDGFRRFPGDVRDEPGRGAGKPGPDR